MRQIIADFRGNPAAADWHFLGSTATNLQALKRVEWGKKIEKIVDFDKTL